MKGLRRAVYRMGAVDVSREGGFLQRSELGGAARVKEPMNSGSRASLSKLSGVKEELSGGMVSNVSRKARGASGAAKVVSE